jgi:hypothetical protein
MIVRSLAPTVRETTGNEDAESTGLRGRVTDHFIAVPREGHARTGIGPVDDLFKESMSTATQ